MKIEAEQCQCGRGLAVVESFDGGLVCEACGAEQRRAEDERLRNLYDTWTRACEGGR